MTTRNTDDRWHATFNAALTGLLSAEGQAWKGAVTNAKAIADEMHGARTPQNTVAAPPGSIPDL